MSIVFDVDGIDFKLLQKGRLTKWIRKVIHNDGMLVGEISYLFTNDDQVLETNIQYLNHDTYTDIITFDYVKGKTVSGDIMISVDRVRENAQKFEQSFESELCRVIIHGVLHLLGQGDKSDEEAVQMRAKEKAAIELWYAEFAPEKGCGYSDVSRGTE